MDHAANQAKQKEALAQFLTVMDRGKLMEFARDNLGETDNIDFKKEWPERSKLARHVLALANSGGGLLFLGMEELDDLSLKATGLAKPKDEADVRKMIKKYVPDALPISVLTFQFPKKDYPGIPGEYYQVLSVWDLPGELPMISEAQGKAIDEGTIYVRRNTESEKATQSELRELVERRVKATPRPPAPEASGLKARLEKLGHLYRALQAVDNDEPLGVMAAIGLDRMRAVHKLEHRRFLQDCISQLRKKIFTEIKQA